MSGGAHTQKQLFLDTGARKPYWCDREGMRVMGCDLDGSTLRTASIAHTCAASNCNRLIEIGDVYRLTVTAKNDWLVRRMHPDCERASNVGDGAL